MPRGINTYDEARLQGRNSYNNLVNSSYTPNGAERNVLLAGNTIINQPSDIITDGLVLYLDAALEASYPRAGTTWFDLSPNRNNGTLINGTSYSIANAGGIVFDGVNDQGNLASLITIAGPSSVSFWIRFASIIDGIILGRDLATYYPYIDSTFVWIRNGSTPSSAAHGGLSVGIYENITLTSNSTTVTIFKNGISVGTMPHTGVSVNTLGCIPTTTDNNFEGQMGNVCIYNRELTAAEVLQNFNATRTRFGR